VPSGASDEVVRAAQAADVPVRVLGTAGGERLVIGDLLDLGVDEVVSAWRGGLSEAITGGAP
jgi:hypothetical protein